MAIQIQIRIKESDWDSEYELAQTMADEINAIISEYNVNIPVLIVPVEDPENEMEPLIK
jgi:hypothetical protein